MTHRAVGFGRGFPRAWLVPVVAMTVVLGFAVFGVLSRSIVADLIAWWPVWAGLGVAAFLVRDRQVGPVRAAGLVPIAALLFVGLFTWGHLAGWPVMPSASERLVGPAVGETTSASLEAGIDGEIVVSVAEGALYRVDPVRRGGAIGVPTASEHVSDTAVDVLLQLPADPGLYSYAGWDVVLSPLPDWSLDLSGSVEGDLTGLDLAALRLDGAGTVELGAANGAVPVTVAGSYHIVVPPGSPTSVVGRASVPATWELTDGGARAPIEGEGWTITVVGDASVSVVER